MRNDTMRIGCSCVVIVDKTEIPISSASAHRSSLLYCQSGAAPNPETSRSRKLRPRVARLQQYPAVAWQNKMGKKDSGDKPSKGKGGGGGGGTGGGGGGDEREQKLQAILLADSFTKTFRPVTWQVPKVLLPLVNVPMLEYTIEFLAQNGVEELFLVCVWHADVIQSYINSSKWPSTITVRCINITSCLSAGDALRELDSLGLVRSDPFILISGDVISNMDLKKAIAFHKEKRKEDNNCIMTVVLKPVQKGAGAKPVVDDLVVALDRNSGQMLLFEDSYKKKKVSIPLEILADHSSGLSFHTDLLDCNVDICSPELMLQFSDNFDYQDIRKDFISNEVVNWELGMHIYGYLLQNEYAARVQDPRTYNSICWDIVTRWPYPMVPDAQLLPDGTYTHIGRYVYTEKGVKIDRTAVIGDGGVFGKDTVIEGNVSLRRTILGRGCKIGAGSTIVESHLWAGAIIEAGASVTQSIICDRAVVKKGAKIARGCFLSYDVVIGENVKLPEYTRVSMRKRIDDGTGTRSGGAAHSGGDDPKYDTDVLGPDGKGYVWSYTSSGDYDEDDENESEDEVEDDGGNDFDGFAGNGNLIFGAGGGGGAPRRDKGVELLRAHSLGCKEEEQWKMSLWRNMPKPIYNPSESDASEEGEEEILRAFRQVVADYISTGHAEGHAAADVLMEIKGFKFSQNRTFADCLSAAVPEILGLGVRVAGTSQQPGVAPSQVQVIKSLKNLLDMPSKGWGYVLLEPLIQKDTDDELVVLEIVEDVVLLEEHKATLRPLFSHILQLLYHSELVTEETILRWSAMRDEIDDDGDAKRKLFDAKGVQDFLEWLEASSEEDGDDDEDDDDSGEEGEEDE